MKNKVLIKLIDIENDSTYDIFLPVNEYIWKINEMISKATSNEKKRYIIINKKSGVIYNDNSTIIETDIRNGTELIYLSII